METRLTPEFANFTELLEGLQTINQEQKSILDELFRLSAVHYETGTERESRLREFVSSLAEITWQYIESGEAGVDEKLGQELQVRARALSAPQLSDEDLGFDKSSRRDAAHLLFHIDVIRRLSNNKVSPVGTFAVFPQAICRLVRPVLLTGKEIGISISGQLASIAAKVRALPSSSQQVLMQALDMAGSIGRHILTDLHAGGPINTENIYELGSTMYRDEADSLFVFSRTPGLIIPAEYYGDDDDNPYRSIYFNHGLLGDSSRNLRIYYQWNRATTAVALYKGFAEAIRTGAGEVFRDEAASILNRFLRRANIEITEGMFGYQRPEIGKLKRTMTIVNKSSVVKTSRDRYSRSIDNAVVLGGDHSDNLLAPLLSQLTSFQVEPKWSSAFITEVPERSACSIPYAVKALYDEDVLLTVKPMGHVLHKQAAYEHIDRLIALGREELKRLH